jgi:hypothetical protein
MFENLSVENGGDMQAAAAAVAVAAGPLPTGAATAAGVVI